MQYNVENSNIAVTLTTATFDVVVGESARLDVGAAINYIKSGQAEVQEVVDSGTTAFNLNASQKTSEFNNNASNKTSDFNTNATNKTNAFNQNATDKTTAFNDNATSKTNAFNSNASDKTGDFNSNATSKTNDFNSNASDKTTDFNDNYTVKKGLIDAEVANAAASATAAAGSAADAKQWAIGDPSEPTGNSAKYWADEAATTVSTKANVDLSNLSATGEAKFIKSVTTGATNGTISVDGTDVSVYGLGSAAYTASTAYATSAQGSLADTAVQPSDLALVATSGAYSDLSGTPTIPTVNNATLTITQGGTSKGTFTANASSDVTIALDSGGGGSSRNIGEIVASTIPLTDAGLHLLDGTVISGSGVYADFVDYIADLSTDLSTGGSDEVNATIVGSLTINDCVLSDFSLSDYAQTPSVLNLNGNTWEIVLKFHTPNTLSRGALMCDTTYTAWTNLISAGEHFIVEISTNRGPYDLAATGTYTILPNTDYWVRFSFDGSQYKLEYSLDGTSYITDITLSSNYNFPDAVWNIGRAVHNDYAYPWGGSIDLKGCYVKINNHIFWKGTISADHPVFTTEADWQNSVTTYGVCGKFVYDDVNNTVRLPKITGFIEGATDGTELGNLIEAGLPNITGQFSQNADFASIWSYAPTNGAFTKKATLSNNSYVAMGQAGQSGGGYDAAIDASLSSLIYGNSSTVQPQAIKVLYYIVVATSVKTPVELDIDEIMTDLAEKADDNAVVHLTGDTMTGDLEIEKYIPQILLTAESGAITNTYPGIIVQNNRIDSTSTTAPSTVNNGAGSFLVDDMNGILVGGVYIRHNTNNNFLSSLSIQRTVNNVLVSDEISVGIDVSGTPYCNFPNTKRVDGQWVFSSSTIASSASAPTSTASSFSLASYLPNDGYKYEVLFTAQCTTGTTSGNQVSIALTTDIITSNVYVCRSTTRTSSDTSAFGSIILPVGTGRSVVVDSYSANAGTYSLYARAYRRIGGNS